MSLSLFPLLEELFEPHSYGNYVGFGKSDVADEPVAYWIWLRVDNFYICREVTGKTISEQLERSNIGLGQ